MDSQEGPKGIGGWLILPALALCAQPVGVVMKTLEVMKRAGPGRLFIMWPAFWFDLLMLLMVGAIAWAFFRKKVCTAPLFVFYIASMWIFWAIISGVSRVQHDEGMIGMIFHLIILVPYLLLSRRVSATFVEGATEGNVLDQTLDRMGQMLEGPFKFLQRQRWFLFLHIPLYFFAMGVLNAAIRSLYLSGGLRQTWELLF